MTISDFYEKVSEALEIPITYREFSEEESKTLDTPYAVYFVDEVENLEADNIVYWTQNVVMLEIYTDNKDLDLEIKVETFLNENELIWTKGEDYIPEEKLNVVYYRFTI